MKKIIIVLSFLLFSQQTFALSCRAPLPTPALYEVSKQYATIGTLEILSFETEDFMPTNKNEAFPDLTAEGKPRKFTTHKAQWKSLKKGTKQKTPFTLKINGTSWMGIPSKFEPKTVLPITTEAVVKNGVLTLNQDFGCGKNDWDRHSIKEINQMKDITNQNNDPYLGLTVENARNIASANNRLLRVVQQDGEYFMVTDDFRPGRINAVVVNNIVTSYTIEGENQTTPPSIPVTPPKDTPKKTQKKKDEITKTETKTPNTNNNYLGKSISDAQTLAQTNNTLFRVVQLNGKPQIVTRDFRPGRINAVVKDDIVTSYTIEGENQATPPSIPVTPPKDTPNTITTKKNWFSAVIDWFRQWFSNQN